tara:strand:+ start:203 stop:391 length:189 start_codon:yes stop_codon:yes gene_type:complete
MQRKAKSDVKDIVEIALKDFSDVQVNLTSKSAREAIALRIASDISSRFNLVPEQDDGKTSAD